MEIVDPDSCATSSKPPCVQQPRLWVRVSWGEEECEGVESPMPRRFSIALLDEAIRRKRREREELRLSLMHFFRQDYSYELDPRKVSIVMQDAGKLLL